MSTTKYRIAITASLAAGVLGDAGDSVDFEVMAAEPGTVLETMALVDYTHMDDFGRVIGYAAETIALGDLGCVTEDLTTSCLRRRKMSDPAAMMALCP